MKRLGVIIIVLAAIFYGVGYFRQTDFRPLTSGIVATPIAQQRTFTMVSTGDIGLGRYVNYQILENKDSNYPFLLIANYLRSADLTIANLEGPLIENCPVIVTGFKFCGEAENVSGLRYAGVDAVNLANNHSTNYGLEGLEETRVVLKENNIRGFGLENQIEYITVNGNTVALLGFVELGNNWGGLSNATDENVTSLIAQAKDKADIVITAFHWGPEYTHVPSENQVRLGRLAIDSGADLVLGNHAHWIQPLEIYNGKPIVYAQGNTVFDQDWSRKTREGVLYTFKWSGTVFEKIDERYTIIEHNSQPRLATDDEAHSIRTSFTP